MNSKDDIWTTFERKIIGLGGLTYFKGHFRNYFKRCLLNFIEDGVIHIEARAFLGMMFHEDGTNLTVAEEMDILSSVIDDVKIDNPHFTFFIIIQGLKMWDIH